jgi:DNA-binding transcriptional LysR family regulator
VRAFEAAARHVNFALAADELAVTPGAVSRHVKALEAQIGRKLFDRYPQSLELTEFGRTWLPVVSEAFDTARKRNCPAAVRAPPRNVRIERANGFRHRLAAAALRPLPS